MFVVTCQFTINRIKKTRFLYSGYYNRILKINVERILVYIDGTFKKISIKKLDVLLKKKHVLIKHQK